MHNRGLSYFSDFVEDLVLFWSLASGFKKLLLIVGEELLILHLSANFKIWQKG
jgi:hypothetical protein